MKKKPIKKSIKCINITKERVDWFNALKREDLGKIIYNISPNDVPFQSRGN